CRRGVTTPRCRCIPCGPCTDPATGVNAQFWISLERLKSFPRRLETFIHGVVKRPQRVIVRPDSGRRDNATLAEPLFLDEMRESFVGRECHEHGPPPGLSDGRGDARLLVGRSADGPAVRLAYAATESRVCDCG